MRARARFLVPLAAVLVALLVGACRASDPIREARPSALANTAWRAVELNGRPTVSGSEPTLIFMISDIRGYGGCNDYFGTFTFDPETGAIDLSVTGMTARGCPEPAAGDVEAAFVQSLDRVTTASIDPEGRLVLSGPDEEIVFEVDAEPTQ